MIVNENEKRKLENFEIKLESYKESIEQNGDTLTDKQRDAVTLMNAEFTIENRYLILELHRLMKKVAWSIIGAAGAFILSMMSWIFLKVLPQIIAHLGAAGL